MLTISDVLSVVISLDRKRQVEILLQLYEHLDTELTKGQLELFSLSDDVLLRYRPLIEVPSKVTRLSVIFDLFYKQYDSRQYALQIPLETVFDNFLYNPSQETRDALAYKIVTQDHDVTKILEVAKTHLRPLLSDILRETIVQNKPQITQDAMDFIFDHRKFREVSGIFYDLLLAVTDNEASREILNLAGSEEDSAHEIIDILGLRDMEHIVTLTTMLGAVEYVSSLIADDYPESYPEYVVHLLKRGYDINSIIKYYMTIDESKIILLDIANNQV